MDMNTVDSSMFSHAGYDETAKCAHLTFKTTGKTYSYPISSKNFCELLGAPSMGKHFNQHIRNAHPGREI